MIHLPWLVYLALKGAVVGTAAAGGAALVYLGVKKFEKHQAFASVYYNNQNFKSIYNNAQFAENFRNSSYYDKEGMLLWLESNSIINRVETTKILTSIKETDNQ